MGKQTLTSSLLFILYLLLGFTITFINAQLRSSLKDTVMGTGAANVRIEVYKQIANDWEIVSSQRTNEQGDMTNGITPEEFTVGVYKLVYYPEPYYAAKNLTCFYPEVEIQFEKLIDNEVYFIVVSMSPYGYSIYRGQLKSVPPKM